MSASSTRTVEPFASSSTWIPVVDLFLISLLSIAMFAIGASAEVSERLVTTAQRFERVQLDELPLALLTLSLGLAWFAWRRWREMLVELRLRQASEGALRANQAELRDLSRRITESQETERRALAHELHDELGQTLNAIKIEAVTIRNAGNEVRPEILRAALAVIRLTDGVYAVVRAMTSRLRPVALDELGLAAALEHDLTGWRERLPQVRFTLRVGKLPPSIDEAVAIAVYRVAQEGLTNIVRHADARQVTLELEAAARPAVLRLKLCDDGRGVDLAAIRGGLGLLGMRERIAGLGGVFRIDSRPGQGFRVDVSVPVDGRLVAAATP